MFSKPGAGGEQGNMLPTTFPATTPPIIPDQTTAILQMIAHMQATLGGIAKQIDGIDKKIEKIEADGIKHGKWIFAASVVAALVVGCLGFMAKALWDLVLLKLDTLPK